MKDNIKVSCIIPIYNSELYLDKTIISLLSQTLKEIEIICVNDASSDRTKEILYRYQQEDKRIKIINNLNRKGAAVSRNNGLKYASGDYVIFLDADDEFFLTMLKEAYDTITKYNADLLMFGYQLALVIYNSVGDKIEEKVIEYKNEFDVIEKSSIDEKILKKISHAPWNKLVRREMILSKEIYFQDIPTNNDTYFSFVSVLEAERIVISDKVLIKYYEGHTGSLTESRINIENRMVEALGKVYKHIVYSKIENKVRHYFLNYMLDYFQRHFSNQKEKESVRYKTQQKLRNSSWLLKEIGFANENGKLYPYNVCFYKKLITNEDLIDFNNYYYHRDQLSKLIKRAKKDNKKIALWGCGKLGKRLLDMLEISKMKIDYAIDNNATIQGKEYGGYMIYDYSHIKGNVDFILVTNSKFLNEIEKLAYDKEIICLDNFYDIG